MKLAFLISTGRDARHLNHLINSLPDDATYYVLVDSKRSLLHFKRSLFRQNVNFISHRVSVVDGSIGEVEAQVELLRAALTDGADYMVFLSGQDYPLWKNSRIIDFFSHADGHEFITGIAMSKPLRATRFGLQLVGGRPLYFEGYYTYTPGDLYTDENQVPHPEVRDTCSIYSVLYEVEPDNVVPLYGDDVLTSPRIVAVARLADPGEPTEWTHFRLPFVMQPGKTFSEERLRRDGYAIAIVASASQDGDYFRGAVGSELCIDELRIVWEGEE